MDAPPKPRPPRAFGAARGPMVGVVGPCSAGKSTLVGGLNALGHASKSIGQEHSYVPHMWQVIGRPDVLVYLDVSFSVAQRRRWLDWQPADLDEQRQRLRHAREHCDLYIDTDRLSPAQVRARVTAFLEQPA